MHRAHVDMGGAQATEHNKAEETHRHRVDHLMVVLVRPRQLARVHLPQHDAEPV